MQSPRGHFFYRAQAPLPPADAGAGVNVTLTQGIAPGAVRRYAPIDGSSTVAYRFAANQAICVSPWMHPKIAVNPRPSASLVASGG